LSWKVKEMNPNYELSVVLICTLLPVGNAESALALQKFASSLKVVFKFVL
jgi:hypothetical protein